MYMCHVLVQTMHILAAYMGRGGNQIRTFAMYCAGAVARPGLRSGRAGYNLYAPRHVHPHEFF